MDVLNLDWAFVPSIIEQTFFCPQVSFQTEDEIHQLIPQGKQCTFKRSFCLLCTRLEEVLRITLSPDGESPLSNLKSYSCQGQTRHSCPSISSMSPRSSGPPAKWTNSKQLI